MAEEQDAVRVALRTIEIVGRDGVGRRHLRVFCPVETRSIDPRTCAHCDLCVALPQDPSAAGAELRCLSPRSGKSLRPVTWFVGNEAVSAWLPAGALAGPFLLCARLDASVEAVARAFDRNALAAAVVVDERTRVLGVLGRDDLRVREGTPVLAVVDANFRQLGESAPLAGVIAMMAYHRARRVVLVASDATAAGLVTEVDLLRWVAVGGER